MRDITPGTKVIDDMSPGDLIELGRQLHILRVSLDGALLSESQRADMETLAMAEVAAEDSRPDTVRSQLARVGAWTIAAALDVDALLVATAISAERG